MKKFQNLQWKCEGGGKGGENWVKRLPLPPQFLSRLKRYIEARDNMYDGDEIASLFMKHTSTKLQAGTQLA